LATQNRARVEVKFRDGSGGEDVVENFDWAHRGTSDDVVAYRVVEAIAKDLKPCRSPYCECAAGQCTHPGCYDARGESAPKTGFAELTAAQKQVWVESDPLGRNPHAPGAKLDAGKRRDGLVLLAFSRALAEVSKVGTYGAQKYTDNGWIEVPNGVARYTDALFRHMLAEGRGEKQDADTKLLHAAHAAWNSLARLDLMLRELESTNGLETRNNLHPVGASPLPAAGAVLPREDEQSVQQRDSGRVVQRQEGRLMGGVQVPP